jgi:peptidyl-tRNA hydrolase, PTH1 family
VTYLKQFFRSRREKEIEIQPGQVYLIVGLGNPGREYKDTRHNIGFLTIDQFAQEHEVRLSRVQNQAIIGIWNDAGRRVILAKPQTYMNLSGQAVAALARFYKVPVGQILVIHDDVDLPIDTIRMRPGGGSAGQKGVKSIIEKLGTQEFPRLRMGIGRPPGRMDAASYVLQTFTVADKLVLQSFLDRAVQAVDCFISDGLETAMNKFNPSQPEK